MELGGTEGEVEENLGEALGMEVEVGSYEGHEVVGGTFLVLEATRLLTQEVEPVSTMIVDASNWFNEMSHIAILWTM